MPGQVLRQSCCTLLGERDFAAAYAALQQGTPPVEQVLAAEQLPFVKYVRELMGGEEAMSGGGGGGGGVWGRLLDWAQQQERRPGWKRSGSGRRRCTSTLGTRSRSCTRRRRPGPSPHHHRAPRIQQSMCDELILGSSWTSRSNGTRGGLVLGYIPSFNLQEPGAA